MARAVDPFIDTILWESPPRTIGACQWRAIVYTLPARYGVDQRRFAFQFRRISTFGSTPEIWTQARDFPGYARYLPFYGLPKQLGSIRERYLPDIGVIMGTPPAQKGGQLNLI